MQVFKFTVINDYRYRRSRVDELMEGVFIKQENNEIIGKMDGIRQNSYIKGLFLENSEQISKLIFVEINTDMRVYGYRFKDIEELGQFSVCDWLSGLFDSESEVIKACVQVEKQEATFEMIEQIKKEFQIFYESLDDWNQMYFDDVQKLREFINYR